MFLSIHIFMGNKISSKSSSRGFTLIELAVGLAVLGLMMYTALAIFAERSAIDKVAVTNKKLDVIESALRLYYLTSTPLQMPCPSNGASALADDAFGMAACGEVTTIGNTLIGVVPTRTLNLPDSYMFDGWGKRITYVVSQSHTNDVGVNWAAPGTIEIIDTDGNTANSQVLYTLISHGKNGIGAYRRDGGAKKVARDSDTTVNELRNARVDVNGTNVPANNKFSDVLFDDTQDGITPNVAYFDDIVRWKTKEMVDYDADRLP